MKKILLIALCCLFLFTPIVLADRNTSSYSVKSASALVKRGDWKIYKIDFIATTGVGNFAIYDELTPVTESLIRTEGSQATTGNDVHLDFTNKPLEGSTGLYLVIVAGTAVIEYE